jgi:hypothetical protein
MHKAHIYFCLMTTGTHIFLPDDNFLQTTKAINVRNDTRINKYMNTFMSDNTVDKQLQRLAKFFISSTN